MNPSDVQFHRHGTAGQIVLDRPAALNALNLEMINSITTQLQEWNASGLSALELTGSGARGFCSGVDVRAIRTALLDEADSATAFLASEYQLDGLLAAAPVPVTAHLFGISMGGGLGLTHGAFKSAAANTQWAMPEVGIGFWPDSGMSYELARCPGQLGVHLALTGATIDAASALYAGLVDEVSDVPDAALLAANSQLAADAEWIAECYDGTDPTQIVQRLEAHPHPGARAAAALIRSRSPLGVAIAFESVQRAAGFTSVAEALNQDLALAAHLASSDFAEGVRAQLVDKDHHPVWRHRSIEDVKYTEVTARFKE